MNIRNLILPLSFAAAFLPSPPVIADTNAISEMAKIMIHLNHRPSADEKRELREIIQGKSVTAMERALATAMINLEHRVTPGDKKKLMAIVNDDTAPANVRELARIIASLSHKPSGSDKEKLRNMMR